MMYYENLNYANDRLSGTVIYNKEGVPVYVYGIASFTDCSVKDFIDNNSPIQSVKLSDLSLVPVKLGWLNYKDSACYLVRKPIRGVWKQGLCMDNIVSLPERIKFSLNKYDFPFPCKELYNTIVGNYPSLVSCLEKLNKGKVNRIAFSRYWAIDNELILYYKGRTVGVYDLNSGEFKLNPQEEFLKDYFFETMSVT